MNLRPDMVGNQTNDPLAVRRGQAFPGIGQPLGKPVDPEAAVGVEHDLDDRRVIEPGSNRGPERSAQHPRAARCCLGFGR